MILFEVTLGHGRTAEQVDDLIQMLTRTAASIFATDPDNVRVIIREIPLSHSAKGGVTIQQMRDARAKAAAESAE